MTWLVATLLCLGVFFQVVATIGILRLPDIYTRIHTVGKADTIGLVLVTAAIGLSEGFTLTSLKLALLIAFVFVANPAAAHALGHAALRCRVQPWTRNEDRS